MFCMFYVVIVILYVLLCCHVRRSKDTHYAAEPARAHVVAKFVLY